MIRHLALALCLCLLAAACDEQETLISHVAKLPHAKAGDLVTMQEAAGLKVEIHGIPWKGATDAELAEHLRTPPGESQDVRFQAVPTGQWVEGRGHRLVLHFNPGTPPNSPRDCQATAEMRTDAPADQGFRVNATFCTKGEWVAHGYLEAPKLEPGDWEGYTRAMQTLLMAIFAEEKDR